MRCATRTLVLRTVGVNSKKSRKVKYQEEAVVEANFNTMQQSWWGKEKLLGTCFFSWAMLTPTVIFD